MKHYYEVIQDLPLHLLYDSYEYIRASDSAHGEEHVRAVVMEADRLYPEDNFIHKEVILAALLHDVGCSIRGGRDKHEVHSKVIAKGLLSEYIPEHLQISILNAIVEHRASFSGERTDIVSKTLAAADRGRPNAPVLFLRAYLYASEVNDVCHEVAIDHALKYNVGKYGYEGYSRMQDDELLMSYYPEECVAIEKVFEEATPELVESCLKALLPKP